MRAVRTATVGSALVLALALPATVQAQAASVEVVDNDFVPETITVTAGGTVTWNVTGTNPHTITADDGSFDESVSNGDTFARTFDTPGTYAYYCRIHGAAGGVGMSGTIVVQAAPSPSPSPTATTTPVPSPSPSPTAQPVTGSLTVSDQTGNGAAVTVDAVTISGSDGFVVVHADQGGAPGPVLGHAAIVEGTTTGLQVPMDAPLTGDQTVWPMLHVDAGTPGAYEFPGPDGPVQVDGEVVVEPLAYTLASGDTSAGNAASGDAASGDQAADDELATTGRDLGSLASVALLTVALGAGLLARSRRRGA